MLSLVPIAIAYHLAHYFTLLAIAGQFIIPLASDPFGYGWDLFGTTLYRIDIGLVDARFIWYLSVAAIVIGHIVAVWIGHMTAYVAFRIPANMARRSQYPMLVLMIGYTMLESLDFGPAHYRANYQVEVSTQLMLRPWSSTRRSNGWPHVAHWHVADIAT